MKQMPNIEDVTDSLEDWEDFWYNEDVTTDQTWHYQNQLKNHSKKQNNHSEMHQLLLHDRKDQ